MKRDRFLGATLCAGLLGTATPARAAAGRRALVLTGGGALGAYEAGAAIELLRGGAQFDIICGTSIGAINGAFLAMQQADRLADLWHNIAALQLIKPKPRVDGLMRAIAAAQNPDTGVLSRPYDVVRAALRLYDGGNLWQQTGFFEPDPIQKVLHEHLQLDRIRGIFAWSTTNLDSALTEAFYVMPPEFGDIVSRPTYRAHRLRPGRADDAALFPEAIRASAAIPIVFDPVVLQPPDASAASYVDGGISQNAPIGIARHLGATDIVGITADAPSDVTRVHSLFDVIFQSYAANQNRLVLAQLADGTTGTHLERVTLVRPDSAIPLGVIGFDDQAAIDAAFERGRADAARGPQPVTDVPIS